MNDTTTRPEPSDGGDSAAGGASGPLRIGILGTGALARGLGSAWIRAGHRIAVGGRSPERARVPATGLGPQAEALPPHAAASGRDAVLLAVPWDGAESMLGLARAHTSLRGTPLIDPTNLVDYGSGALQLPPGESSAERIAAAAPGAHVMKVFQFFPSAVWEDGPQVRPVVAAAGAGAARAMAERLIRDAGGTPAVLGGPARARQLEEAAGFLMGLVSAGHDPAAAFPAVS